MVPEMLTRAAETCIARTGLSDAERDEMRGQCLAHLLDAYDAERRNGKEDVAAQHEALRRFGDPRAVRSVLLFRRLMHDLRSAAAFPNTLLLFMAADVAGALVWLAFEMPEMWHPPLGRAVAAAGLGVASMLVYWGMAFLARSGLQAIRRARQRAGLFGEGIVGVGLIGIALAIWIDLVPSALSHAWRTVNPWERAWSMAWQNIGLACTIASVVGAAVMMATVRRRSV